MLNDVIVRVLYPEEKCDGEDGEDDQGPGDDAVYHLLPVMDVKDMRLSDKSFICAAETEVTFYIWKLKDLDLLNITRMSSSVSDSQPYRLWAE